MGFVTSYTHSFIWSYRPLLLLSFIHIFSLLAGRDLREKQVLWADFSTELVGADYGRGGQLPLGLLNPPEDRESKERGRGVGWLGE